MKKELDGIHECRLINNFTWVGNNCFERPQWILCNGVAENSILYFLLFNDLKCDILDINYKSFICDKVGYELGESLYGNKDDTYKTIKNCVDNSEFMIIVTNLELPQIGIP